MPIDMIVSAATLKQLQGPEYGKPYNLMEPLKTDTVLRKTFNSNDEYLKFLKDYSIEKNSKKR